MRLEARRSAADGWRGTARLARWPWMMLCLGLLLMGALTSAARAQDTAFKDEELDQMLAPIALYPDSLLSQILMASTYPADVAEAVAWSKAHPDDKGDAAIKKVENQPWEPAVQSLVAFPQVLSMMGARPGDVQRLGDAFLADPARVMDRVQVLRKKAKEAGNLKTTEQQNVSTTTQENKQVIIIEPAQPTQVYVPVYQPTVVYGTWGYPSYPPYYWAPPPYYYPPGAAFVGGVLWGAAIVGVSNGLWGGANWGRGDVNINVNKYNNINTNRQINSNNTSFKHNAERRGDVPYRDSKSREQYGQTQREGAKDREAYRGKEGGKEGGKDGAKDVARDSDRARAEQTLKDRGADPAAGREKLQGTDRAKAESAVRDSERGSDRSADRSGDRAGGAADRGTADRSSNRTAGAADRSGAGSSSGGALAGVQNGSASRADADRGRASTASMNQRSSGASGGARPAPSSRPAPAARPSPAGRAGGGGRR